MIAIVDCGISNLRSVVNAFEHLGAEIRVVRTAAELREAPAIVLPGVGSFGDGMRNLDEGGFTEALPGLVAQGRPLLGICLGMQLLADGSSEYGDHSGLGLVAGTVERIASDNGLRVPHVGWNTIDVLNESPILSGLSEEPAFYFAHSYHLSALEGANVTATTDYGSPLAACVQRDHVLGVQFHPEKSQSDGLKVLENFVALCAAA